MAGILLGFIKIAGKEEVPEMSFKIQDISAQTKGMEGRPEPAGSGLKVPPSP